VRRAGLLLHPTSLPGRYGIGDIGDEVIALLDWIREAGLRIWQVLPLNPPGYGNSPYGCLSSYAGNPLLISLPSEELPSEDHIDFNRVRELKQAALRKSFAQFRATEDRAALTAFERDNAWLPDWALFATLKEQHGGRAWMEWPPELASCRPPLRGRRG